MEESGARKNSKTVNPPYKTRSVRFRLTVYFVVFAAALMAMLWLF